MRAALLVALVLGVAAPASAQRVELAAFSAAVAADWGGTYVQLQRPGTVETNRLLSWANGRPAAIVIMGASIDVATGAAWVGLTRRHPVARRVGLLAMAAARTVVVLRASRGLR